ncbi:hypothetical protein CRM22_011092 [Opisthorchis felineus]|uniref:Protein Wnt n=1 Tax=Opisthorchis felineus TaxID=147828 RepID=A0A4V3S9V1_OPIFE|nr:hypothetical protein CRM22_011092 [Opisthorchis felineus]TGZ46584.1 hypothetical protein CRM22_011092 [Opisthorchis felineus]
MNLFSALLYIRVLKVWLLLGHTCVDIPQAIGTMDYWWNLGLLSWQSVHRTPAYLLAARPLCVRVQGLTHSQTRLCQRYFDHMPVISIGAKLGIYECQNQFKYRHWNCSSQNKATAFGPVTHTGSREASFAHAISAAGVVHALARSCKEARLHSCGCNKSERPDQLHRDWIWGGCGDNIAYAYRFAKAFIDVREKEKSYPRHSQELARMLMNLHNNRAGRLAVYKHASVACKCHGVSGSCSLRTCWTQLSPFSRVGRYLRERYDDAIKVKFNRRGTKLRRSSRQVQRITPDHLTYLDESPDYCEYDPIRGIPGTKDRECLPTSGDEMNCTRLCCQRGSRILLREIHDKCHCQVHWCCRIECQSCSRAQQYHVCN